ncbi:hypothetical protein [Candidatus Methylomirabilis sp.]|uniref:Uncharacterized protein n=1 Tax=Candidatus Methylomirabilis tolerans TaxID=3123416 RepID=A0AAJ1EJE7_9BACT|nr:hypothetical protein [Candidatus Methylomirabilis sp.]
MKYLVSVGFAVMMTALGAAQVWAHGGGGMGGITEGDICSIEKGQHIIHFSAYQHATAGAASQLAILKELKDADLRRYLDAMKEEFQSYCRDIPKVGKATLTFDLVSDALRRIPVAVRVVEARESDGPATVLYIPQQVYSSGVVRVEAEFTKAGKYEAVVELEEHAERFHEGTTVAVTQKHTSAAEEDVYHAHDANFSFPLTVGLKAPRRSSGSSSMLRNPAIIVTTIAGMAIGTVLYVRRRKKVV